MAHLSQYFIVRISWVFGIHGKNFVKTMLNLAQATKSLSAVGDQVGSPTYTHDLAPLLAEMITSEKYGIYHATNEGFCSWAQFATKIFRAAGKAVRPLNSRLSKQSLDAAGFCRLPLWQDAVARYIEELRQEEERNKPNENNENTVSLTLTGA